MEPRVLRRGRGRSQIAGTQQRAARTTCSAARRFARFALRYERNSKRVSPEKPLSLVRRLLEARMAEMREPRRERPASAGRSSRTVQSRTPKGSVGEPPGVRRSRGGGRRHASQRDLRRTVQRTSKTRSMSCITDGTCTGSSSLRGTAPALGERPHRPRVRWPCAGSGSRDERAGCSVGSPAHPPRGEGRALPHEGPNDRFEYRSSGPISARLVVCFSAVEPRPDAHGPVPCDGRALRPRGRRGPMTSREPSERRVRREDVPPR